MSRHAKLGFISLVGSIACATISAELFADLTSGTEHFRLPRPLKYLALACFLLFTCLETNKVRTRVGALLRVESEVSP